MDMSELFMEISLPMGEYSSLWIIFTPSVISATGIILTNLLEDATHHEPYQGLF